MGLKSFFTSTVKGNFQDGFNYLFMDEDAITTNRVVNNAQEKVIQDQYARGVVSEDELNATMATIGRNSYPFMFRTEGGPGEAFKDELSDRIKVLPDTVASTFNKTVGGATSFILKALPWYVWVLLFIALVVYLTPILAPTLKLIAKRK